MASQFLPLYLPETAQSRPLTASIQLQYDLQHPTASLNTSTMFRQSPKHKGIVIVRRERFVRLERETFRRGMEPRFANPRIASNYTTSRTAKWEEY